MASESGHSRTCLPASESSFPLSSEKLSGTVAALSQFLSSISKPLSEIKKPESPVYHPVEYEDGQNTYVVKSPVQKCYPPLSMSFNQDVLAYDPEFPEYYPSSFKCYLGNIPCFLSDVEISNFVRDLNPFHFLSCSVNRKKSPKVFAFLLWKSEQSANECCLKLNRCFFKGRSLKCYRSKH